MKITKELLEKLIDKGYSQHLIAKELKCSQSNIRYWLKKFELETNYKKHPISDHSELEIKKYCKKHGMQTQKLLHFPSGKRYRCIICISGVGTGHLVKKRRKQQKKK